MIYLSTKMLSFCIHKSSINKPFDIIDGIEYIPTIDNYSIELDIEKEYIFIISCYSISIVNFYYSQFTSVGKIRLYYNDYKTDKLITHISECSICNDQITLSDRLFREIINVGIALDKIKSVIYDINSYDLNFVADNEDIFINNTGQYINFICGEVYLNHDYQNNITRLVIDYEIIDIDLKSLNIVFNPIDVRHIDIFNNSSVKQIIKSNNDAGMFDRIKKLVCGISAQMKIHIYNDLPIPFKEMKNANKF